jgi:bacteriocin biosynthesis cyclodehydratase domain-containing protein
VSAARSALLDRNLGFPQRPRLVPDLDVFRMPDGLGVQFRGGEADVLLRGRLAVQVLPWLLDQLDGKADVGELLARRPAGVSEDEVADLLLLLLRKGLLADGSAARVGGTDASSDLGQRQLLFWGRKLGVTRVDGSAAEVEAKLAAAQVVLLGSGLFGASALDLLQRSGCRNTRVLDWDSGDPLVADTAAALGLAEVAPLDRDLDALGIHVERRLTTADLLVTALRNAPDALFSLLNAKALRHGVPWLRGNETAAALEIGPYVNAIDSPCFGCLRLRQRAADDFPVEEQLYQEHLAEASAAQSLRGEWLPHATAGAALLAAEATRILTLVSRPVCEGAVLTLSPEGGFSLDSFQRVPRCPECYPGSVEASP